MESKWVLSLVRLMSRSASIERKSLVLRGMVGHASMLLRASYSSALAKLWSL
jgi:hypothetical protein